MITIKTPAKVNWSLSVLKKRSDGYHDIISLVQAIDLFDTLSCDESDDIEIICDAPIKIENNLVNKAIKALQDYTGIRKGVKIILKKEIPLEAGLAGGSSNASATLKALTELWKLNLSFQELQKIGTSLGSDVSFFFHLPICIVEGKGEIIKPLSIHKSYSLLLVKPAFGISTKWAYQSLDIKTQLTEDYEKINNNIYQLYELLFKGVSDKIYLWNDLEKPVIKRYPEIENLKKKLLDAGARATLMSGSGSTVFGLFKSKEDALVASEKFNGYWFKVVQTLVS
jgi:4-diphosphocytidyl-2-C-methyl-D-erythritol kinase